MRHLQVLPPLKQGHWNKDCGRRGSCPDAVMLTRRDSQPLGYASISEDMLQTRTLPQLRRMVSFPEVVARPKEAEDISTHSLFPYLRTKLLERRRNRLLREQSSSLHSLSAGSSNASQCALPNRLLFSWQQKFPPSCPIKVRSMAMTHTSCEHDCVVKEGESALSQDDGLCPLLFPCAV